MFRDVLAKYTKRNRRILTWKAPWLASTSPSRKLIPFPLYWVATSWYFDLKVSARSLLKFKNNMAYTIQYLTLEEIFKLKRIKGMEQYSYSAEIRGTCNSGNATRIAEMLHQKRHRNTNQLHLKIEITVITFNKDFKIKQCTRLFGY